MMYEEYRLWCIRADSSPRDFPPKNHTSSWWCKVCGAQGKYKVFYKSTLRERVRAHLICRCRGR